MDEYEDYEEDIKPPEEPDDGTIYVQGLSGGVYPVLNEDERGWWERVQQQYEEQYDFNNISDRTDLDSEMALELVKYRYDIWRTKGFDYEGLSVEHMDIDKKINELNKEIRLQKKSMGIDKASRNRDKQTSVAEYIENLRQRANEFGVHRNQQAVAAITIMNEVIAIMTYSDNCNEDEQKILGTSRDESWEQIRDEIIPRFTQIDNEFKLGHQKYWMRDLG